jgi:hypothetical protein
MSVNLAALKLALLRLDINATIIAGANVIKLLTTIISAIPW